MARTADLVSGVRARMLAADIPDVRIGPVGDDDDDFVALTPYPIDDDTFTGTSLFGLQVVVRGTAAGGVKPVLDRQDQILDLIGSIRADTISGIPVSVAWRQMSAPIAPDGRGRPEIRDTYYLRSDRPGIAG